MAANLATGSGNSPVLRIVVRVDGRTALARGAGHGRAAIAGDELSGQSAGHRAQRAHHARRVIATGRRHRCRHDPLAAAGHGMSKRCPDGLVVVVAQVATTHLLMFLSS